MVSGTIDMGSIPVGATTTKFSEMNKSILLAAVLMMSVLGGWAQKKSELKIGVNAHWEVTFNTSKGMLRVKLYNDTPLHRDNFIKLCKTGYYDHLLFHRTIKDFMIQTGDPDSREASTVRLYGQGGPSYTIPAEIRPNYFHKAGALAAAREDDEMNPRRDSHGSQFFIVAGKIHSDSSLLKAAERIAKRGGQALTPEREQVYKSLGGAPHLDGQYTVFGEVVDGMKTVVEISQQPTIKGDRPIEDIYIKNVTVKMVEDKNNL